MLEGLLEVMVGLVAVAFQLMAALIEGAFCLGCYLFTREHRDKTGDKKFKVIGGFVMVLFVGLVVWGLLHWVIGSEDADHSQTDNDVTSSEEDGVVKFSFTLNFGKDEKGDELTSEAESTVEDIDTEVEEKKPWYKRVFKKKGQGERESSPEAEQ